MIFWIGFLTGLATIVVPCGVVLVRLFYAAPDASVHVSETPDPQEIEALRATISSPESRRRRSGTPQA